MVVRLRDLPAQDLSIPARLQPQESLLLLWGVQLPPAFIPRWEGEADYDLPVHLVCDRQMAEPAIMTMIAANG